MVLKEFIAHVRKSDGEQESVKTHLEDVAVLAEKFASKVALPLSGRLIGLSHDLGKYSKAFQNYLFDITGNAGEAKQKEAENLRGKIDHAAAGAQVIWRNLHVKGPSFLFAAQILATCVASHHTGLSDFLNLQGESPFINRMMKEERVAYREEALASADCEIRTQLEQLLASTEISEELWRAAQQLRRQLDVMHAKTGLSKDDIQKARAFQIPFHLGGLVRFLFSCLVDADRVCTARFDQPYRISFEGASPDWDELVRRFEQKFQKQFQQQTEIGVLRQAISDECAAKATRPRGLFTLSVPTGGGKTLTSLRFALRHAQHHQLDRIIYVVPYTSIIEQNAQTARDYLGDEAVLEHHSNLTGDKDTWKHRILSENWDAPVVFTTSVQFLNALFSRSTQDVRRMHQLANATIIFDEIQTLPIKTVHMFNNAVHFLLNVCGTSVVSCTATQPLLDEVDVVKGSLAITSDSALIHDLTTLFKQFRRTEILDRRKKRGWQTDEVAQLAISFAQKYGSSLVIVNTKISARALYDCLANIPGIQLYHLSTNMCPAHRKQVLKDVQKQLDQPNNYPLICISTQLIEAGVDIDFGSVIRYLAGLDSIAQAGGRCNRHGKRAMSPVIIVNPAEENVQRLPDINNGKEVAHRILDEWDQKEDLMSPATIKKFFRYYFHERREEMDYPIQVGGQTVKLLDLIAGNSQAKASYEREHQQSPPLLLLQSFSIAGNEFKVIDAPSRAVLVRYGKVGAQVVDALLEALNQFVLPPDFRALLRRSQQYSVNVFPWQFEKLQHCGAIYELREESDVYCLKELYYHNQFGLSLDEVQDMEFLNV